jgi:hypothetical protein
MSRAFFDRDRQLRVSTLLLFAAICPSKLFADDGAASIAAGGLVARRETRIVMAKEVLHISEKKVVVDYDFRNDTDEDVTTEVAFPVPPYKNYWNERDTAEQAFTDFKLEIDGTPARFQAEANAMVKGKDVTSVLNADKIDIATFGHFDQEKSGMNRTPDLARLPERERKKLIALGLFDANQDYADATWTVHLQYHWTQTFPAHASVHIRHEYSPVIGYSGVAPGEISYALNPNSSDPVLKTYSVDQPANERLSSFCADSPTLHALESGLQRKEESIKDPQDRTYAELGRQWVDFILTTANTWKQPIQDFTLIIERPKEDPVERALISLCSPGPVERLDADHFQVHLTNFVPKAELHIGFFGVPSAAVSQSKPRK